MKEFNINRFVAVRLTDMGRQMHRMNYEKFLENVYKKRTPYKAPIEDGDGWSTWQMHELFSEFGRAAWVSNQIPFETTIRILD